MTKKLTIIILLITQFAFFQNAGYADSATSAEYKIKGVYIKHFTQFITWSKADYAKEVPFKIVIIGNTFFGSTLGKIFKGKKIAGRTISISKYIDSEELINADLIYISKTISELERKNIILKAKSLKAVTISDIPNFIESDGIIGFVKVKGKLKFEINLKELKNTNRKISGQILKLANKIIKGNKNENID